VFSYKIFTFHETNTFLALPNASRRSVRALALCYHNNNGSETAVVETVEQKPQNQKLWYKIAFTVKTSITLVWPIKPAF
jgi:hypothetical protein